MYLSQMGLQWEDSEAQREEVEEECSTGQKPAIESIRLSFERFHSSFLGLKWRIETVMFLPLRLGDHFGVFLEYFGALEVQFFESFHRKEIGEESFSLRDASYSITGFFVEEIVEGLGDSLDLLDSILHGSLDLLVDPNVQWFWVGINGGFLRKLDLEWCS